MKLLGSPRRMPSMAGYGLEVTGFIADEPDRRRRHRSPCKTLTRARPRASTARDLRIGIVQARFNAEHHRRAGRAPACAELAALGVAAKRHRRTSACPARSRCRWRCRRWPTATSYDALVALGCIIRGETYHFELVANESGAGVTRVVAGPPACPIANAILTAENEAQAVGPRRRQGPRRGPRGGRDGQPAGRPVVSDDTDSRAKPRQRPPRTGARKRSAPKSARRRAREFALQGLYEWLVGGADAGVDRRPHARAGRLRQVRRRALRRAAARLHRARRGDSTRCSPPRRPQDRASSRRSSTRVLMIGAYELKHCIDVPYSVVINEAVELAKSFGGTDGHKYVNGVLDKAAAELRRVEVEAARAARG